MCSEPEAIQDMTIIWEELNIQNETTIAVTEVHTLSKSQWTSSQTRNIARNTKRISAPLSKRNCIGDDRLNSSTISATAWRYSFMLLAHAEKFSLLQSENSMRELRVFVSQERERERERMRKREKYCDPIHLVI